MTNPNFPAVAELHDDLQSIIAKLQALDAAAIDSANLVPMVKAVQAIGAYAAAIDAQITDRAIIKGELVPGVALKDGIKHRQWHSKEAAEQLARETFGDNAFEVTLKSPAGIEKLGDEGKMFVSVASFKPEAPKKAVY